jgi:hypothetical protein
VISSRSYGPILTLLVGPDRRKFRAHEEVLRQSTVFSNEIDRLLRDGSDLSEEIRLPEENSDLFSSLLQFLYKGDYEPAVDAPEEKCMVTIGGIRVLRDTAMYCLGVKYGIPSLQDWSLKKLGKRESLLAALPRLGDKRYLTPIQETVCGPHP